jgi:hypothetical protein
MTREEFKQFVERTLEGVIRFAEEHTGKPLSRKIAFRWFSQKSEPITENIAEHITQKVYIDENHIYPCIDIGVGDILDDGTVLIYANHIWAWPCCFPEELDGQRWAFCLHHRSKCD